MPISRDESLAPPLWPDANRNRPGYYPPHLWQQSDFNHGFDAWWQHGNSDRANAQLSLWSGVTMPGSEHALAVINSDRQLRSDGYGINSAATMAMQRGTMTIPERGMILEMFWYVVFAFDLDSSPRMIMFGNDIENWGDPSWRALPTLRCQRFTGKRSDSTLAKINEWQVRNDAMEWITVHTGRVAGPNEAKPAVQFCAVLTDFDFYKNGEGTDGCPWGIREVTINDLTIPLNGPGQPQVGRGRRNPQGDTGVGMTSFEGGFNRFVATQNSSLEPEAGPNGLLLLRSQTLYYEPAA